MTVWITDKIKTPSSAGGGSKRGGMMDLGDLKGYPLEMEMAMNQQGMEMKMLITTTDVSTSPIDDNTFTVSTDGYKMSSFAEYQEQMKKAMSAEK